jgi:hypothetical protein
VSFLSILPLAIVMVAGPQLLSAIFLAVSANWRRNSAAYLLGAALSISIVVSLAYVLSGGTTEEGGDDTTLEIVVVVLLLAAMLHVFLARKTSEPPKWMGKLQDATPRFAFRLGCLLLGVFPTDILTSVAIGATLAKEDEPLWKFSPFLMLTLLFLALPSLTLIAFGERGGRALPGVRDWMNTNAWVVNEIVLAFFVVLALTG